MLASDIPVFREIADGGFQPFDPYVPDSIAQAMLDVANDDQLREDLIQRGKQLLPRYDWAETARQTFQIYQQVLGNLPAKSRRLANLKPENVPDHTA